MNVIEVKNLSKKYNLIRDANGFLTLRDIFSGFFKNPVFIFKKFFLKEESFWALKDVNFNIKKGEIVGIIGLNGAGKSTLLKILSKITTPTKGEIKIKGRVASLLEVGTGFHPELSGRENIYFNGVILGMSKKEIDKRFDEIVEFSEVKRFLDIPVKRYSSGMAVKLAFSIAAHMEPDILLVDEVLAVGDIEFQKKCIGKMNEVTQNSKRTILFVSHNMSAIKSLCQRCILIDNGRIKMFGNTGDVMRIYLKNHDIIANQSLENINRRGNGKVKIKNIVILDGKSKNQINNISSGQDIFIKIDYESSSFEKINSFNLGLAFYNANQQFVMVLNSEMANRKFKNIDPKGSIYCSVPKFPLMIGKFYIKSTLVIDLELSDQIERVCEIMVSPGDFFGTGITNAYNRQGVYINHSWSLELNEYLEENKK